MKKGVIGVCSALTGATVGALAMGKAMGKSTSKKQELADKHLALYKLMNQWVQIKQDGKSLVAYFEKNQYQNIAIYGMNYVGQTLYRELEGSQICVKYAIDRNAANVYAECSVITMEGELDPVDAVIVTPIFYYDDIEEELEKKMNCPIISIEDIIYEV